MLATTFHTVYTGGVGSVLRSVGDDEHGDPFRTEDDRRLVVEHRTEVGDGARRVVALQLYLSREVRLFDQPFDDQPVRALTDL